MRNGIDFRRTDCEFSSIKKRFIQNQGLSGYAILQLLLDRIYFENGYYITWDSQALDDFAYDMKMKSSKVTEIVNYALHLGIFDKEKYKELGVLTSLEIQKNYNVVGCKRVDGWHNKKVCYSIFLQKLQSDSENIKTDTGNGENNTGNKGEKSIVSEKSKDIQKKEIKKENQSSAEIDKTILSQIEKLSINLNKNFTHKGLCKIDFQSIDFDKLEQSVKESEFLTNSHNLDINWLIIHYDQIINGNYKNFEKQPKQQNTKNIITRPVEDIESSFSNLDDDWD